MVRYREKGRDKKV